MFERLSADAAADLEEEARELYTLQLQSFARSVAGELSLIDQEISLLDHMDDLRELDELAGHTEASSCE